MLCNETARDIICRCNWAEGDTMMEQYHDEQWGVPVFDDTTLFEFLVLESAQAGLSWKTILDKCENYKIAYKNFDIEAVANFTDVYINELLNNPGIVRNRLKIQASVNNAQRVLEIQNEFGTFSSYLWGFVENKPLQPNFNTMKDIPTHTAVSDFISKDLKKRGFKFIGTTIIYSFMQAVGMTNDHIVACFRYSKLC